MHKFLKQLMERELYSAGCKSYRMEMSLATVAATIFAIMSFTATTFSWAGLLLGVLYVWHRFVVMNVAGEFYAKSHHDKGS